MVRLKPYAIAHLTFSLISLCTGSAWADEGVVCLGGCGQSSTALTVCEGGCLSEALSAEAGGVETAVQTVSTTPANTAPGGAPKAPPQTTEPALHAGSSKSHSSPMSAKDLHGNLSPLKY